MSGQIVFNFSNQTGPLTLNVMIRKDEQNVIISPFVPVKNQTEALDLLQKFLNDFGSEIIAKVVPEEL